MSEIKDGGPAFPADVANGAIYWDELSGTNKYDYDREPGMSLRDYFAAKALAALINHTNKDGENCGQKAVPKLAAWAYEYADAMIKAREA